MDTNGEGSPTDSRTMLIDSARNPPGLGSPGGPGRPENIFRREVDRDQCDRGLRMARIERGLRSASRRMENRVSIKLSETNSLMRVEKREEELSKKRYSRIKMHSRSWESSSSRFRLCPTAERSRSAGSTPTSAYSLGRFLLSSLSHRDSQSGSPVDLFLFRI